MHRNKGFTMVELLLVLVILAVLAAIVVPRLAGRGEQARETAAVTQISVFKTALNTFEIDNGYFPSTQEGLDALIEEPSNAKNWRGPYLESNTIPLDPWQNAYTYEYPGKHNERGYDIMSMGLDGRMGGDDDVVNWETEQR